MKADLIISNIGQLVTCASGGLRKRGVAMSDAGIIVDGAVAVSDGQFLGVGKSEDVLSQFSSESTIDAEGRAVCPGFVDPHTHIVFAGDRLDEFELKIKGADYLEILANGGGIISTVRKTRAASVYDLVEQGRKRLDRMLTCGTTTCEIKTGYGLETEAELKMLDVIAELDKTHAIDIVPTFLAAHAVPPEFNGDTDGYVNLVCDEMLPQAWAWYRASHFAENRTPFFADVFCERNAFDPGQAHRILSTAKNLGFGIKAHVDQFTNLGGTGRSIDDEAVSVDHLDTISDVEIVKLAASSTVGIVIPTENFNAGKTVYSNARKMIDAGCTIAISTDFNPGSAPCPSQPMAMSIACRYQKLIPSEALNAATINAAFGIGLGESHGSIEVGKAADLVMFECEDHRMPLYEFGGNLINSVFKKGEVVIRNK